MIILLSPDTAPQLTDLDRFDRLHATAGRPLSGVRIEGLCSECDDEHVWLDIEGARQMLGDDPSAVESFDAMISYAASKGWVDDDGDRVRAHVQQAD